MYQKKSNFRGRRARRGGGGGLLLIAVLLLVVGGMFLLFHMRESRMEDAGKVSTVSDAFPAAQSAQEDRDETQPPEDKGPAAAMGEPYQEPVDPQTDAEPQPPTVPEDPEEPTEPDEPQLRDVDDWHLLLVNPWNPKPEDYEVTLKSIGNGHKVDERCYDDLQDMLAACEAEGLSPIICSSYRTQEKQESLFQNKIQRLMNQGLSEEEATVEAAKVVAVPGTSEHQLGLALDIVDVNNQVLDKSQEGTPVQQWLMAHSWEYGFILRYPNEKSEITGIIYEPWHYRYVGKEYAAEIYEQGVCLEEYLGRVEGTEE